MVFTNHGADVQSWQLKKYRGNDGKRLDLVNSAAGLAPPFSLDIPSDKALEQRLNWTYYAQTPDPDGLGVTYQFSDGHVAIKKTFRFEKNSYLSRISSELTIDGRLVPNGLVWRCGFGDLPWPIHRLHSTRSTTIYRKASWWIKAQRRRRKDRFKPRARSPSLASRIPTSRPSSCRRTKTPCAKPSSPTTRRRRWTRKSWRSQGIAVSDGDVNQFRLFVGPKDFDLLKGIDPKLEKLVDFGWLAVLAKPLFLIVNWANDNIVHSFGWAIILITIVINLALFPLRISSMKSMRKMQALKPQIDAINSKYKGLSVRDPKKADQTAETMDLYKKNGVNPMGGCLPMVLQLPILIAFYRVFSVSVEMRGASWLWVTIFRSPNTIPIRLLPLILIATQFLTQKMMPQPGGRPDAAAHDHVHAAHLRLHVL